MNFIKLNNVIIHYRFIPGTSSGNGSGKTFVFINSLGTDFRIWNEVAVSLKDYGNILLYDKRGHGLSDDVNDTNGLTDFTEDVLALMQYHSVNKCIPVGLSVGGMIAQLIAHRKPEVVEK